MIVWFGSLANTLALCFEIRPSGLWSIKSIFGCQSHSRSRTLVEPNPQEKDGLKQFEARLVVFRSHETQPCWMALATSWPPTLDVTQRIDMFRLCITLQAQGRANVWL